MIALGDAYEIPETMLDFNDPDETRNHQRTSEPHTVTVTAIDQPDPIEGGYVPPPIVTVLCSCGATWQFPDAAA